jgi:hypothetical protein
MELSRHWRLNSQRYSLVGEECHGCGAKLFPPRDVCPDCSRPAQELYTFSGRGTIYSYSTVYNAPSGYEEFAPYTVALVELDEGPMLTAQLTDLGDREPEIGMPVEMVTRRLRSEGDEGIILYGYKFRPLLKERNGA